jgi:drug/metabolite transporter (DMT)-like permease
MFYLLATILLNVVIVVIMKLFPRYGVNALQAIVVNYWTCVITGSVALGRFAISAESTQQPWFWWAVMMGAGFIAVFNLIAFCTKVDGITITTIANKLSLAIPVIFSVLLYHDGMNASKLAGILIAFPAVYLTASTQREHVKGSLLWPVLLFFLSGLLDTLVKYVQVYKLPADAGVQAVYTIHVFCTAAVAGTLLCLVLITTGKMKLAWKNVVAGICLGIPNYFSIYLFIRLLASGFMQSSAAIPVLNTSILLCSSLVAIVFFREKLTVKRAIGLVMALAAILLITLGDRNM